MATTTTIHGELPEGIRDPHGVLYAQPDLSPRSQLARVRAKVSQLTQRKNEADRYLRVGVEANDGRTDLNEAARAVKVLADQLEGATETEQQWASVVEQMEKAHREDKLYEVVARAKKVKEDLRESYLAAALALGEWYELGIQARDLYAELGDRMPTGHVYHRPELREARTMFDANPDPRPELLEDYQAISTFQSWKRELVVMPLVAKGK